MERFKFRLQKLLNLRIQKEEESKIEFKKAQVEKKKVEDRISELQCNFDKFNYTDRKETVIEQKIKYNYLNAVKFTIEETKEELSLKERNLNSKLQQLKICQIERKTVETLKEKKKECFIKEQNLSEQKVNDELALYGYIRRWKGGEKDAG